MPDARILFIDDDPSGREVALFNLRKAGYQVDLAEDGRAGAELFAPDTHELVITDVRMPGLSGMEVLAAIHERDPETPVVVITAYGNVELAVEAMQAGAVDFIGKPFNREHLLLAVERALEGRRVQQELRALRRQARGIERPIVARSQRMLSLLDTVDRVAASDATVLLTGESGTGKELIARRLHARSDRADGPFVAINCAAVPLELLESELFGHVEGAFTGARADREGRFRQAAEGTLLLDEIGELPAPLQAKLLRVLQEKTVDIVGGDTPVAVDVRVVASTNRDLPRLVQEGVFRVDLFYRLNVIELRVPPLRNHAEDVEPLARHFVEQFAAGRALRLTDALLDELRARPWRGNVRELQNACERLVILCAGDTLNPADLPPVHDVAADGGGDLDADPLQGWPPLPADGLSLVDLERGVIERALALKQGNVSQTATYLKVPRHVLAYRMEKYGIDRPR